MIWRVCAMGALLALAGCGDPARYLVDPPAAKVERRVALGSLEVRNVQLPAYAAAVDMTQQDKDGALKVLSKTQWADDPVNGFTTALARSLDIGSTATVAAEPWPLEMPADARLEVRVERMFARLDGQFELSGQYALSSPMGAIRDRLVRFNITIPVAGDDPSAIATASGAAVAALADNIIGTLAR